MDIKKLYKQLIKDNDPALIFNTQEMQIEKLLNELNLRIDQYDRMINLVKELVRGFSINKKGELVFDPDRIPPEIKLFIIREAALNEKSN